MRPVANGVFIALLVLGVYFLVVVATTPSLPPLFAVSVALTVNWWVVVGLAAGTGVQTFFISYANSRACNLRAKRQLTGSSGVLSVFSSFTSYLALIPVGCCGTWLYILSLLPGILGTGVSVFLIDYGEFLALSGLLVMAVSVLYTYLSVRSRMKTTRTSG